MPLAVCRVAVVTYPFDDIVGRATLDNLIQLLRPSAEVGPIITGAYRSTVASETVEVISSSPPASSPFRLLASKALESAQITAKVAGLSRQTNVVIFFLGARVHPFAVFAARLKGMKTIVVSTGSSSRTILKLYGARFNTHWGQLLSRLAGVLERLSFLTASVIGVESRTVTKFLGLENLESRVAVVGAIFVDERIFSPEKRPSQRPLRFGYIGRLSPEKGVLNFADALDLILPGLPEYRVTIGGAGPLEAQIRRQLKPHGNRIDALGWIDHTTVARRLNELRLLVLPSYSEGLPGTVLEAMACGTPVLATPVGGIPDVIQDGETGFLLSDNKPQSIASRTSEILTKADLDGVASRARSLVEREYSFDALSTKWEELLRRLL
ncbi:MAG: hypothetical protein AUG17_02840 [Crenarchaeota archaeon 13_1_20CM_2_53_14]|nr:MAG: hypothetical protein AUG17_02840 [Crenarchaeota archaeon 13_1_20CM_2_53_14]